MKYIEPQGLDAGLPLEEIISRLRTTLQENAVKSPERIVLPVALPDGSEASLLIMPVWKEGEGIGVKVVTYFPNNNAKNLPAIHAGALYFDGQTGALQTLCEADTLTARRTAAGSALAADYLARQDAKRLLVVGTGQLALSVAKAHALMRDYERVEIWGRNIEKAQAIAQALDRDGLLAIAVANLEEAVRQADTVSTITSATSPVLQGEWVRPGTHIDLIGSFRADMRESDDALIVKASIFVDTMAGAKRSGDLSQPLDAGLISEEDILSDLHALVIKAHAGRKHKDEITLFKSAGFALEDYVAMEMLQD